MKRIQALLMAGILALSLIGCSSSKEEAPTKEEPTKQAEKGEEVKETKENVSYILPGDYFGVEDGQEICTQDQLDEHSKDGLKYEFTDDNQILCTVVDQEVAKKAAMEALDKDFADFTDPNSSMYIPSYRSISYNDDLSEITIVVNADSYSEYDSWWSALFLNRAVTYQMISGVKKEDTNSMVKIVTEEGEELYSETAEDYK